MDILDAYYKKTINFKYLDKNLKFKVSQALFSSHIIDSGTQRLLRTFMSNDIHFNMILDLGCGYGPIGITLTTLNPSSEVHMVDRDALALEYTRLNAKLNSVNSIQVYGSLGYDSVTEKNFDLIISNIPAKVGKNVLSHMLIDAKYFLKKNGLVAIVVVDAILDDVNQILSNPDVEIVLKKSWNGHTVFHYKFGTSNIAEGNEKTNDFETGLYNRTESTFKVFDKTATLKTTYNLSEFDEMSYETQMLLDNIKNLKNKNISSCLLYNVNQGHIPVSLSLLSKVDRMIVVDKNLQSLKVTERNLISNGFSKNKIVLKHQTGINTDEINIDCIIAILDDKEERAVNSILVEQIISQLSKVGIAYIVSSSNIITQVENKIKKIKGLLVLKRLKHRGVSFLSFTLNSN